MVGPADVLEEGRRGDGEHAGEEVARPAVAAGGGRGVGPVGADHVVDCGHVDAVVGDADDGGEDHGAHPLNTSQYWSSEGRRWPAYMEWWSATGPGKPDQTDR